MRNLKAFWSNVGKRKLPANPAVNTLPPDVLESIFLLLASSVNWEESCYVAQVSHVCRYWRAIALDCPFLWNRFEWGESFLQSICSGQLLRKDVHPSWLSSRKERCRGAPIHLKCKINHRPLEDFFFPWSSRLCSLLLEGPPPYVISSLLPYENDTSSLLRSLSLKYDNPRYEDNMATEWTHNMKLFNNELPNLEILRLDQYPLQWDLICASTKLRELTLVNLAPGGRLVPDAISSLSLLQSLTIEEHDCRRFTPLVTPGSNDASHPFHLPYLQHVSFRGHTNWVLPFLESLTASSLTCLLISCKRAVNEQLPRLRQAIHTLLTGGTTSLAQTPFQYLRAEYCGISALKCSADLSNDHQGCSCLGPTFQLLIKDPSPDLSANIGKLLILPLIRNLNRRYITQLNWTVEDSRMGDRFFDLDKDYFHSMDHLEELSIGTSLANGFDGLFPIKVPHASEPTSTNAETRHAATPEAGVLQSGFTQGSVTLASPSISPSVLSAIFDNNSLPLPRNSSKPRQKAIPTLASIGKVFGIGTSGIYHQPANTAHPSVIVPCPALRRILIYNEAPYLHPSTDARLNLAESLIDLLQKRGDAGRRLELLDLTKCLYGVEKKHMAKLGELVDQLICRP